MSDMTPRLALPLLLPSQAQKHVTHNEAIDRLDALVQLAVAGFGATVPPAVPEEGLPWALGAAPVGAWAGHGGTLARWRNAGWDFITPQEGWLAWGIAEGEMRIWLGGTFVPLPVVPMGFVQNLSGLGIGAVADAVNRLSVNSPASLLNHAGEGHEATVNKAAAGFDASVAFKTGFSARALAGLLGDDNWRLKVSPNGSAWFDALVADRSNGRVTAPNGMAVTGSLTGTAVTQSTFDTTSGRVMRVGAGGLLATATSDTSADAAGLPTSFFRGVSGTLPPAGGNWHIIHISRVLDGQSGQIAVADSTTGLMAVRGRNGAGTWGTWSTLYGRANLLGNVSQSGGVPTGAVIERGSNANGEYVRFADGTQICSHRVTVNLAIPNSFMGGFRSNGQNWTFPASFAAAPAMSGYAEAVTAFGVLSHSTYTQTTGVWAATAITSQSAADRTVSLIAIGRWF